MSQNRVHRTYNDIQEEQKCQELAEMRYNLCTSKHTRPCGNCVFTLNNIHFLESTSFRFLMEFMLSTLRPLADVNKSPHATQCYVKCNGNTHIKQRIVDPEFKLTEDLIFCSSLLRKWIKYNTCDDKVKFQIDELLDVFDETTTSSGLLIVLKIFCINYDIWVPVGSHSSNSAA